MILSAVAFSQNGGLVNENSVIRIDYITYDVSTGKFEFEVTNKQSCQVNAQYMILHTNGLVNFQIAGNGTYTIYVPGVITEDEHVKVRATSFCPQVSPDQGWVETDSQGGTLLPIKLVSFSVVKAGNGKGVVTWVTAEESNVDRFEVEKSSDGRNFTTALLHFPNNAPSRYSVNLALTTGTQYFRLKTIDLDGKFEYSPTVSVKEKLTGALIKAYSSNPNTLTVELGTPEKRVFSIYSASGVLVSTKPSTSSYRENLDISGLPGGIYIVRTSLGESAKFIK